MALINMRNGLMAGGGWKNPYVTDGLVAMLDGEWNVAGGKHDASATTWNDIAGGHTVTQSGSNFSWNGNSIYLGGSTYFNIQLPELTTAFTAEVVGNYAGSTISSGNIRAIISNRTNSWNNRTFQFGVGSTGTYQLYCYGFNTFSSDEASTLLKSHTIISNGSQLLLYCDATYKRGQTVASTATYIAQQPFRIGAAYTRLGWTWIGNINSVRFYSRALTSAEIAANYAVDKARFSLPDAT